MAYLTNEWKEKRSFDFTGGLKFRLPEKSNDTQRARDFNNFLAKAVTQNPQLFADFSNEEIVDVLIALDKADPDTGVLIALYAAYKPERNHELCAWQLDKRIKFLQALDADPKIRNITDRWISSSECPSDKDKEFLADYQHGIQTSIFESDRAQTSPYDMPKPPTGPYGGQNIWSASFWREGNILFYNTYIPKDPRELFCTFRKTAQEFQSTIGHDTDHTVQATIANRVMRFTEEQKAKAHLGDQLNDHMVMWVAENLPGGLSNDINRMILKSDEMRNFGLLMHYSVYGDYYLSQRYANGRPRDKVTFKVYETNPSEQHTYAFQRDVDRFLLAEDSHARADIIQELKDLRNRHLDEVNSVTPVSQHNYPQSEMALAA